MCGYIAERNLGRTLKKGRGNFGLEGRRGLHISRANQGGIHPGANENRAGGLAENCKIGQVRLKKVAGLGGDGPGVGPVVLISLLVVMNGVRVLLQRANEQIAWISVSFCFSTFPERALGEGQALNWDSGEVALLPESYQNA